MPGAPPRGGRSGVVPPYVERLSSTLVPCQTYRRTVGEGMRHSARPMGISLRSVSHADGTARIYPGSLQTLSAVPSRQWEVLEKESPDEE